MSFLHDTLREETQAAARGPPVRHGGLPVYSPASAFDRGGAQLRDPVCSCPTSTTTGAPSLIPGRHCRAAVQTRIDSHRVSAVRAIQPVTNVQRAAAAVQAPIARVR